MRHRSLSTTASIVSGIALLAAFGRTAAADERPFSLGVNLAGVNHYERALFGDRVEVRNALMPELNLSVALGPRWSVEVTQGYYETTIHDRSMKANLGDLRLYPTTAALQFRVHDPDGAVAYYFAAGVGYDLVRFDTSDEARTALADPNLKFKVKNAPVALIGTGLDAFIDRDRRVAVRASIQYRAGKADVDLTGTGLAGSDTLHLDSLVTAIGLRWSF